MRRHARRGLRAQPCAGPARLPSAHAWPARPRCSAPREADCERCSRTGGARAAPPLQRPLAHGSLQGRLRAGAAPQRHCRVVRDVHRWDRRDHVGRECISRPVTPSAWLLVLVRDQRALRPKNSNPNAEPAADKHRLRRAGPKTRIYDIVPWKQRTRAAGSTPKRHKPRLRPRRSGRRTERRGRPPRRQCGMRCRQKCPERAVHTECGYERR